MYMKCYTNNYFILIFYVSVLIFISNLKNALTLTQVSKGYSHTHSILMEEKGKNETRKNNKTTTSMYYKLHYYYYT